MTLPITHAHARILERLRKHEPAVQFVVVGAVALGCHVRLTRTTSDVDLALVADMDEIVALLAELAWTRDPRIEHRWHGPEGFRADVLPATPALIATGTVGFDNGRRPMSLLGFDLALEHSVEALLPGTTTTVRVASLPALVVLKVIAWLDRPDERLKDLGDIAIVLRTALDDDDERRWDPDHPVRTHGLAFEDQSPFFVGMSVGEIVHRNHRERIQRFIDRSLNVEDTCAAVMAREAGFAEQEERVRRLVRMFADGMRLSEPPVVHAG